MIANHFSLDKKNMAILLHFFNGIIQISSFIFINATFLSSYPISWLPYFFVAQSCIDMGALYTYTQLIKQSNTYHSMILWTLGFITILLCIVAFSHYANTQFFPLIISLFLMTAGLLSNMVSWNVIHSAFDMIEFKEISTAITIVYSFSNILISFLIAILLKIFSVNLLLFFIIFSFIFATFCIQYLKPISVLNEKQYEVDLLKYPLFKRIFIITFFVSIIYTLVDYALKYELSIALTRNAIGEFMAIFNGLSGIISTIINLLSIKYFLSRFGATSLLLPLPLYWLISGLFAFVYPKLGLIAILAAGKYIFYYYIFNMGRELVLNSLPQAVRISGQFFIKSIASPFASGLAAIFLFVFAKKLTIPLLILIIMFLSIALSLMIKKTHRFYVQMLKQAIFLKRFKMEGELSKESIEATLQIMQESLSAEDQQKVMFGFSLLSTLQLSDLPKEVLPHLTSSYPEIRIEAIKAIVNFPSSAHLSLLLQCFAKEENPEVKWVLLDALAAINSREVLQLAHHLMKDALPEVQLGAIHILLLSPAINDKQEALIHLKKLLDPLNPDVRKKATYLLELGLPETQPLLPPLVGDIDDVVCRNAMLGAMKLNQAALISIMVDRILLGGITRTAQFIFKQWQTDDAATLISQKIAMLKVHYLKNIKPLISVLASLPIPYAENQLLALATNDMTFNGYLLIKELTYRTQHIALSSKNIYQVKQMMIDDYLSIRYLQKLITQFADFPFINAEVNARIRLIKHRFLLELAMYTHSLEVFGTIPIFLQQNKLEYAKASELLLSLLHQEEQLSQLLMGIFYDKPVNFLKINKKTISHALNDLWLSRVIEFATSHEAGNIMNTMQKVFVLRNIELFKKLPGEILFIIAEETELRDFVAEEIIFKQGDPPLGLFMIVSGTVYIQKNKTVINQLTENAFFGELALLDDATRSATAIAATDCTTLYLDKLTFSRIIDDQPEVLRAVVQVIMQYLRSYMRA